MRDADAAGADRMMVAVLVQYRMATIEQLHVPDVVSPSYG